MCIRDSCCGGLAGGKVGGSRGGYDLLQGLGHQCTKLYPALVQLKTDNTFVRALKGIRADAAVTLLKDGRQIAWSKGEVQFTEYGVSGPAVFELSRAAATSSGNLVLELDLLPGFTEEETASLLQQRQQTLPNLTLNNLLTGILHNRLGQTLLRYAGIDLQAAIAGLPRDKYHKIVRAIKHFTLPVDVYKRQTGARATGAITLQGVMGCLADFFVNG